MRVSLQRSKMTSKRHLTDFGTGSLSFISYSDTPAEGDMEHYIVTLLLTMDQKEFDYNWGYTAVSRVFRAEQQSWTGAYTAVICTGLQKPLRNAKGLIRSLARKLEKAFDDERADYYQELHQEQWDSMYPDPEAICDCGHKAKDHLGDTDQCTKCGCEYFGRPLDEWYQPTQVWYTEAPGGHNGYE